LVRDLACDIPEAKWKHLHIRNDPVLKAHHARTETGFKKFEKLLLITDTYIPSSTVETHSSQHNPPHTKPEMLLTGRSQNTQTEAARFIKENK